MQPERHPGLDLPAPDEASAAHCRRVCEHIAQMIEECGGSISFAEFMQQALYAPGLGYYVSGTTKFGADGDFVTAPETSPLFGNVLATQIASVLDQMNGGDVFELGAGSGVLAATILRKLAVLNSLPNRYYILEVSADLQKRQADFLRNEVPELLEIVEWLSELPADFAGVIVANEVADALPVERFRIVDGQVLQVRVGEDIRQHAPLATDTRFDITGGCTLPATVPLILVLPLFRVTNTRLRFNIVEPRIFHTFTGGPYVFTGD